MKYQGRLVLCLFLVGSLSGCGAPNARVTGKISMEGHPFVGTLFIQKEDATTPGAQCEIGKGGNFEFLSAPVGKVKFFVRAWEMPGMSKEEVFKMMPKMSEMQKKMTDEGFKAQFGNKLPSWATKEDLPFVFESLKADSKFLSASSSPLEKDLKSGSNGPFDLQVNEMVIPKGAVITPGAVLPPDLKREK